MEMENKNEDKMGETKKIKSKLRPIIISVITFGMIIAGIVVVLNYPKNSTYLENNSVDNCTNTNSYVNSNTDINTLNSDVVDLKPIIYLYPEVTTELSVKLGKAENITCSYPEYNNGWDVIANADGTLIDKNSGRKLYSLYWEGIHSEPYNLEEGFVVKGSDTIQFLEEKLEILGLNEIEAEEFIVYWLPKLQKNEYNYIRFATIEEINKNMPLEFSVEPDTIIRVLMQYKPLDNLIEVNEQKLETPGRNGFVAVEWGGVEIR